MSANSTLGNALFGRRWSLTITAAPSASGQSTVLNLSSDNMGESLRVVFDVRTVWFQWFWTAEIQIWNPNEQVTNFLLTQGNTASNPAPSAPQTSSEGGP